MKRWFGILFLVLCLQVRLVAADEIKDNRLQIDTSRVEQDTNTDQMGQNPLVADLFNEDDTKKIDERKGTINGRLTSLQESLFVSDMESKSKNKSKDLFTSKVVAKEYILPHTPIDKLESLNTTLMYSGVCLLVFGGACYATYRMNKE